jgi:hypothetical protein
MLTVPYISPQEFVDMFPDVDVSRYVPANTQPNDSISLLALLRRASSLADGWCKQQLRATIDEYTERLYPTKERSIRIWPKYRPVVSLVTLQYKYDNVDTWFDADLTNGLTVYPTYFDYGDWFNQFQKLTVRYTYVNGFPISYITSPLTQGTATITVDDATGYVVGGVYTIYDGANSENVVVSRIDDTTLYLQSPLKYNHTTTGLTLSGIPQDIRDAVGIIASNIISRGTEGATVTKDKDFELQYKSDSVITADVERLLQRYQVNR